ncbi:hypothetical protein OCV51_07540 [Faecalicatena acetigenes]|uniref:Uncharacterized protein n=2 Tax=Lachnospiraceae TaxID=186803 RepID=A0ABT2TB50_9FIRM|nr:hypothetical protein [Faecalicatena acetigenes]MCU6747508.1 hypothetical protein [Faecalicatena acetigenes]SCH93009.1 Uncharacterised protein [uncultured Clostridium sp.]
MGGNRKMILEYETLCEKLKEVEDSDAYWECVIVETGCFCKKWNTPFAKRLVFSLLNYLEKQERVVKACEGITVNRIEKEICLPQHYERLLSETYKLIEMKKEDENIRKVYADVKCYKLIEKLEEYREELRIAEAIFF